MTQQQREEAAKRRVQMGGEGRGAVRMGPKVLVSLPAMVLVAGVGALLPLGVSTADASPLHAHGTLTKAGTDDTIVIDPGTYPESGNANVVGPGLTGLKIRSAGPAAGTVIDAVGDANGILT